MLTKHSSQAIPVQYLSVGAFLALLVVNLDAFSPLRSRCLSMTVAVISLPHASSAVTCMYINTGFPCIGTTVAEGIVPTLWRTVLFEHVEGIAASWILIHSDECYLFAVWIKVFLWVLQTAYNYLTISLTVSFFQLCQTPVWQNISVFTLWQALLWHVEGKQDVFHKLALRSSSIEMGL